jgi:hypothetical protein
VTQPLRMMAAVAAALLAAACSGEPPTAVACPRPGILPDANTVAVFRDGGGRDITDMLVQSQIVDVRVDCTYAKRGSRPSVLLELQIAIAAERGPADRTRRAAVPYFVAIVDAERNVVAKETFTAAFEWTDNRPRVGRVDVWEPYIPLERNMDGPTYQVMVGFQLTADQLAWNRSQRPSR